MLATVERLAGFTPPPWRTAGELVEGEARTLRAHFDGLEPYGTLLVAEDAGTPLGFIYLEVLRDYFTEEEHGHVGIVAVTEEAQGTGAGGALVRAAEAWARARGFRQLTLNVFEANVRARRVYEHLGFRVDTIRYVRML